MRAPTINLLIDAPRNGVTAVRLLSHEFVKGDCLRNALKMNPANLFLLYNYEIIRGSRPPILDTSEYAYGILTKHKESLRLIFRISPGAF